MELICEFIISDLNTNLKYCKHCQRVTKVTQEGNSLCPAKLRQAAMEGYSGVQLLEHKVYGNASLPPDRENQILSALSNENQNTERKQCNQQQIDFRLSICETCEFYQNNSCLQCGCALSRDRNFKNKLFWADQSCPIGKWESIVEASG